MLREEPLSICELGRSTCHPLPAEIGPGPSTYKGGIPKYKGAFKIFPALARRRARLT